MSDTDAASEAAALALLCVSLPLVRGIAEYAGLASDLDTTLADVRAGGSAVAACADWELSSVSPPAQVTTSGEYFCPLRRCVRRASRDDSGAVPECGVMPGAMILGSPRSGGLGSEGEEPITMPVAAADWATAYLAKAVEALGDRVFAKDAAAAAGEVAGFGVRLLLRLLRRRLASPSENTAAREADADRYEQAVADQVVRLIAAPGDGSAREATRVAVRDLFEADRELASDVAAMLDGAPPLAWSDWPIASGQKARTEDVQILDFNDHLGRVDPIGRGIGGERVKATEKGEGLGGRATVSENSANSPSGSPASQPALSRFLQADLPERAPAGSRIGLIVQVVVGETALRHAVLKALDVPENGANLVISVSATRLIPSGDLEQDLHLPAHGDSEPLRFGFTTGPVGLHGVVVRAFAGGTFLAEVGLQISVEVGIGLEEGPPRTSNLGPLAAEPGEVTLQVSRYGDQYSFQLMSETLFPVELSRRMAGDPSQAVEDLVAELRAMARGESGFEKPEQVRRRLKILGARLWADAVPQVVREQFWGLADRIRSFTVASETDTVPWELLNPVDGSSDYGFLVEKVPVVRRVYGQARVQRMRLSSAAYVVPPNSPSDALAEVSDVRARLGGGVADRGVIDQLDALNDLFDHPPTVLHFACHNTFTQAGGSIVTMNGGPVRPSDLTLAAQRRSMAASTPLVFFNACRTAGEIPGFTQMMGWAKEFMAAGAGAFVGSMWAVRSGAARQFAGAFYDALLSDQLPLGAASLAARQAIAADSGDPTWLAYTIYGSPGASVVR
jgi:CHAT domain